MILDNGTTIHLTRTFNTNVENLFGCFSSAEAWKSWWKGLDVMKIDFQEGGDIFFSWNHSKAKKHGKILEIKNNELLRFTWSSGEFAEDPNDACTIPIKDTEVTFKFRALENGKSELQLIHHLKTQDHNLNGHYEGWTWALLDMDKMHNAAARSGQEELVAEVERVLDAPIEKVFELWTKPELLNKWFNNKSATQWYTYTDMEEKKCYALDYHDITGEETGVPGAVFRVIGEYKEIKQNEKLVFSWVDESFNYESMVSVHFEAQGAKTKVSLRHSNVFEKEWIARFNQGWNGCFEGQEELLQSSDVAAQPNA